jgi:predicted lipoprotein with Yx(FWY)xxD motif
MRATLVLLLSAVSGLVLVGSAMSSERPRSSLLTAGGSAYGQILFDGQRFALYAFTKDKLQRSACTGACARAWPPYIVTKRPRAGHGITRSLLGTTTRPDGRLQATYAGRPLYYYIGDRKPLQVLCQGVREFGGLWLVVRPNGKLVRP